MVHLHQSKRFKVGFADMIGKRPTMEDYMAMCGHCTEGRDDVDFYGLYDGHAGREAASYAGIHVTPYMLKDLEESKDPVQSLIKAYKEVNLMFKAHLAETGGNKYAGTTAASCYIEGKRLSLVNLGDTRVVVDRTGEAIPLSLDHKVCDGPLTETASDD